MDDNSGVLCPLLWCRFRLRSFFPCASLSLSCLQDTNPALDRDGCIHEQVQLRCENEILEVECKLREAYLEAYIKMLKASCRTRLVDILLFR